MDEIVTNPFIHAKGGPYTVAMENEQKVFGRVPDWIIVGNLSSQTHSTTHSFDISADIFM